MTSLTIAPADLDGSYSRMSKNDARVYGPCLRPVNMAGEHSSVYAP